MPYKRGERVYDDRFGSGSVVGVRSDGVRVRVRFDALPQLVRIVPAMRLESLEARLGRGVEPGRTDPPWAGAFQSTRTRPIPAKLVERTLLEALRLGVVPEGLVSRWTVGRTEELEVLQEWLDTPSEGVFVLEGAYGVGKSHLLEVIGERALAMGWGIAHAHIRPGEENGCHPLRLYQEVVQNLRAPVTLDGERRLVGFEELLVQSAGREEVRQALSDHRMFGPFLAAEAAGGTTEDDWASIFGTPCSGRVCRLPGDYTTVANVASYLLTGLSALLVQGWQGHGLLVLVDEAEELEKVRFSYQRARTVDLFLGLAMASADEHDLTEEKPIRQEGVTRGTLTGLIRSGHSPFRELPYLYQIPSGLKILFAFTEERGLAGRLAVWRPMPGWILSPLQRKDLRTLQINVARLYGRVFSHTLSIPAAKACDIVEQAAGIDSVRLFIKGCLELCDIDRLRPDLVPRLAGGRR